MTSTSDSWLNVTELIHIGKISVGSTYRIRYNDDRLHLYDMISTVKVVDIDYDKSVLRVRHLSSTLHSSGKYNTTIPFGGILNVYQVYKHIYLNREEATEEKVGAPGRSEV